MSLITTSIILCCNRNTYIKRNKENITIPSNHTNYKNYKSNLSKEKEEEDVLLQINILKTVKTENHTMFKNYRKILDHTIHYTKNKNSRIKNANLSIVKEINNLNNMYNIINIHPYNYLLFFRIHNYTLPNIYLKNKNQTSSINNIQTDTNRLNELRPNINNIIFKSEEVVLGAKSVTSLISSSKLLIFSKINKNYSCLYYFSNYLNNLIILNKFSNKYDSISNNLIPKNKFIDKSKIGIKKKPTTTTSNLTNKTSVLACETYNPYAITLFLAGFGTISMVIIGVIIKRKIARDKKIKKKFKNSDGARDITKKQKKRIDKISTTEEIPLTSIQPVKNNDIDFTTYFLDSDEYSSDFLTTPYVYFRYYFPDTNFYNLGDIQSIEEKKNEGDFTYLQEHNSTTKKESLGVVSDTSSLPKKSRDTSVPSSKLYRIERKHVKNVDSTTQVISSKEDTLHLRVSYRYYTKHSNSSFISRQSHVASNESSVIPINTFSKTSDEGASPRKIVLLQDAQTGPIYLQTAAHEFAEFDHIDDQTVIHSALSTGFLSEYSLLLKLYNDRVKILYKEGESIKVMTFKQFKIQLSNFLYQKQISFLEKRGFPSNSDILSNVRFKLKMVEGENSLQNIAFADILNQITMVVENRKKIFKYDRITLNGWFRKPNTSRASYYKKSITTKQEHVMFSYEYDKLQEIKNLLPKSLNMNAFYNEILKKSKYTDRNPNSYEYSELNEFIVNQIILDLHELIDSHKCCVDLKDIDKDNLRDSHYDKITIPSCLESFKMTDISRSDYEGLADSGSSRSVVLQAINDFLGKHLPI